MYLAIKELAILLVTYLFGTSSSLKSFLPFLGWNEYDPGPYTPSENYARHRDGYIFTLSIAN